MERLTKMIGDVEGVVVYNQGSSYRDTLPAEMNVPETRKALERLCKYEDTGLTPEEIIEMKKSANKKCQRKGIIGAPKSGAKILFQKVSEHGIIIGGVIYGIPILINEHQAEKVKIRIVNDIATVFDIETGEQIVWFELFPHKGINCKHKFSPYFTEENIRKYGYTRAEVAKAIKQIKE